jgi:hypothetical protein
MNVSVQGPQPGKEFTNGYTISQDCEIVLPEALMVESEGINQTVKVLGNLPDNKIILDWNLPIADLAFVDMLSKIILMPGIIILSDLETPAGKVITKAILNHYTLALFQPGSGLDQFRPIAYTYNAGRKINTLRIKRKVSSNK